MPALKATEIIGEIVWLGRVPDRAESLRAVAEDGYFASFAGVDGETHAGLTRPSCERVTTQYALKTEIRNTRQFSILSQEELEQTAAEMGLDAIDPKWLGASIVVKGIPDFTYVPPSARLQMQSGATLVVDMENRPCQFPAKVIEEDAPGFGRKFMAAARSRRGVTAWVEREGDIRLGDTISLHIPDQREWRGQ
ncbi:MAG: MOSC domain-containing protein [Paracoccaceae bacterium]|nr:MOSC domain protein [Rhodobacterales bacterium HTCC2150] [Rhodobacteraceae bacterium HTCC2150]MDG1532377.1 MOSC domain-containing protein [Paracoccaceae bacterium]